ncbi:DUF2461 domain-containing protein [Chloroflexota bacterium]
MTDKEQGHFNGFMPETLDFLRNLSLNNNKAWFEDHRQDYQNYLMDPLRNLVMDLHEPMLTIDGYFDTLPKVNHTISRIHRDTRFARDKSPYKTTMWITFKRPNKDWKDAPGYFFEIAPDSYRYGMGFYSASPDTMSRFREMIDENPGEFMEAVAFYPKQQVFVIEGDKYKRVLDINKPEEIQEWYQRKNLYLVCNRKTDDRLLSRELIDDLVAGFRLIAPFYNYMWKTILSGR